MQEQSSGAEQDLNVRLLSRRREIMRLTDDLEITDGLEAVENVDFDPARVHALEEEMDAIDRLLALRGIPTGDAVIVKRTVPMRSESPRRLRGARGPGSPRGRGD